MTPVQWARRLMRHTVGMALVSAILLDCCACGPIHTPSLTNISSRNGGSSAVPAQKSASSGNQSAIEPFLLSRPSSIPPARCAKGASGLSALSARFLPETSRTPSSHLLIRQLALHGLRTLALACPAWSPQAAFDLARFSKPGLPPVRSLQRVASAFGNRADQVAIAFDREYFVRSFLRLSSPSAFNGPLEGGEEEKRAGFLSDIFAEPTLHSRRADPRPKIYSTRNLTNGVLSRQRKDPVSGMPVPLRALLAMEEARAGAAALCTLSPRIDATTRETALATVAWLAWRAYRSGYPRSYPAASSSLGSV